MKADVSTMTRICDRLHIRSKFISGLLENTDAMLPAQGEELGSWHSSQFRSHSSRDAAALKHLESRHELDLPRPGRRPGFQDKWWLSPFSRQHKDRLVALHHESLDVVKPGLQKVGDLTSRRVSDADLNDLWGMASHQSPGQKVVVLRDDSEPFVFRQPPDALVVVASKPDITNVTTSGKARG
jgi:hypothetical protein